MAYLKPLDIHKKQALDISQMKVEIPAPIDEELGKLMQTYRRVTGSLNSTVHLQKAATLLRLQLRHETKGSHSNHSKSLKV